MVFMTLGVKYFRTTPKGIPEGESSGPFLGADSLPLVLRNLFLTRKAGCHTSGAGLNKNSRHVFLVL